MYVLLDFAITQILAIRLLARMRGMHQTPTPMLRGSRQEELHKVQEPSGVTGKLGMAKSRIEVVDDDVWLAALLGASGELAGRVYLEELGDLVSATG